MGNIISNVVTTLSAIFIGLTAVSATNAALGKVAPRSQHGVNNGKVVIRTIADLEQKIQEQFSAKGWKDTITDADGRYNLFKILGAPADTIGNTIGFAINYLINK